MAPVSERDFQHCEGHIGWGCVSKSSHNDFPSGTDDTANVKLFICISYFNYAMNNHYVSYDEKTLLANCFLFLEEYIDS